METNLFIVLSVIIMFLAVAGTYIFDFKETSIYWKVAISGFIAFLASILIPGSMVSNISGLVAVFMLASSLPKLIVLHYKKKPRFTRN